MSKLALLRGTPVLESLIGWRSIWPPTDERTAKNLQEIYYSRHWSAFDETERIFSREFSAYQGAQYGVFMANGTVTLQCGLAAYGVGPGDEVIISPLTWYATAMAVLHVGATPVFVDIEPDTLCMDPDKVEAAVTERTRAIIPVHAYGSMADMDRIMDLAKRHGLRVIEDCAHMHGGQWGNKGVGTIGDVGSFSFQLSKTMSSGEGGICITNDAETADRIYRIKHIGYGEGDLPRQARSSPPLGLLSYNYRATAFQAVILQEQLKSLDDRLERYQRSVEYLEGRLRQSTSIRFQSPGRRATRQGRFGWPLIFDDPRYASVPMETIRRAIHAEGIEVIPAEGPIYKYILFNVDPRNYRIASPCTVTEQVCSRMLWVLHAYLGLSNTQVEKIGDIIEKVATHADELRG